MNKKTLLLILLILFFFAVLYLGHNPSVRILKHEPGFAPDFTLADINGKKFKLSNFQGYPVVIFFGTTWCPQCRSEMTSLKTHYAQYARRGLKIIYIDINESAERVSRFTLRNSYPGLVLLDFDGSVAYDYDVRGVPTIIFVDETGKIKGNGRKISDLSFDVLFPDKMK